MRHEVRGLILIGLLFVVLGSGCLVNLKSSTPQGKFSLKLQTHDNTPVVKNWTAVEISVSSQFVVVGNRSVNIDKHFTAVLLEVDGNVANLSAFPLGRSVYLIPPYRFSEGYHAGENYTSLDVRMRNGSYTFIEVTYQGKPRQETGLDLSFEVEKLGNGSYEVRLIGVGSPTFRAFGREYRVVALPANGSLNFVGIPRTEYLGNWTYILPSRNRYEDNGMTTVVEYPVADIYIEYDGHRAFLGRINFPYEWVNGGK